MSRRQPTDLVNVDFWADRIAAVIKLAEHYGMTVDIRGGELVVSRQVSEAFTASAEVRWQAAAPADEEQQPAADDTDLTEADVDRMMAAGTPVEIAAAPQPVSAEFLQQLAAAKAVPDDYEATTGHLVTCLAVAGGEADPDCPCAAEPLRTELTPFQLLADEDPGPLPDSERVVGSRRLGPAAAPVVPVEAAADNEAIYGIEPPRDFAEAMANPIDRAIFADSLAIELAGGCGRCDTERDHMCPACTKCRCFDHDTCVIPT
ncbi:hypothetical protein ACWDE0_21930 [Streptomyces sp. 900105755]